MAASALWLKPPFFVGAGRLELSAFVTECHLRFFVKHECPGKLERRAGARHIDCDWQNTCYASLQVDNVGRRVSGLLLGVALQLSKLLVIPTVHGAIHSLSHYLYAFCGATQA